MAYPVSTMGRPASGPINQQFQTTRSGERKKAIVAAALGFALGANAFAADASGTAKDAEALVQKAVKHLAVVSKDKA